MNEKAIEAEINAKGLNAPRLRPEDIEAQIIGETYLRGTDALPKSMGVDARVHTALGCLTICILTLQNGFTVVGKSACASPENFDAELGQKIAREDARRQIWALEGYALRKKLSERSAGLSGVVSGTALGS